MTINYIGQPDKRTIFIYDGLGRRTAITSIPGAGLGTTTSYLWCGSRLCQSRDQTGAVLRSYYAEGEFLPAFPAQSYYYGVDQLGSVRRAFISGGGAPAYIYDPYGNPLQTSPSPTDFNYAGMFYNGDSGLYFTKYRIYDPVTGHWLSRDRLGEGSDLSGNLYRYVNGNPILCVDPEGSLTFQLTFNLNYSLGRIGTTSFVGMAVDTSGNVAGVYGTGLGYGPTSGGSVGIGAVVSNAETVGDLAGPFGNAQIGVGPLNGNWFSGGSSNGWVTGAGGEVGLGFGAPSFWGSTNTKVVPFNYDPSSPLPTDSPAPTDCLLY